MTDITALVTKAHEDMIVRHAGLFDWVRDILRPHLATWKRDVIVSHKQAYHEYLESDHWQTLRYRQLKAAGFKCKECGTNEEQLEVHHLTYERLFHERDADLIVLCRSCHSKHHNKVA